jgi:hypothetical protein
MRIPLRPFYAIAAAMALLILSSCRKERLLLDEDPDAIGQFCRIDTFSFGQPGPGYDQVFITYNIHGDPVTMTSSVPGEGGELYDNIFFRYDEYERLRDCFFAYPSDPNGPFPIGSIDLWHRFTYPSPHVIIDSFFNYDGPGIPPVENPPSTFEPVDVTTYELDKEGRTIRTNGSRITTYDDRGNVVRPGIGYDNKVNPYRTNKVWQLLFQDYSMNNPIFPATAYRPATSFIVNFNKLGLPLAYHDFSEGDFGINLFFYIEVEDLGISYSCDQKFAQTPRQDPN